MNIQFTRIVILVNSTMLALESISRSSFFTLLKPVRTVKNRLASTEPISIVLTRHSFPSPVGEAFFTTKLLGSFCSPWNLLKYLSAGVAMYFNSLGRRMVSAQAVDRLPLAMTRNITKEVLGSYINKVFGFEKLFAAHRTSYRHFSVARMTASTNIFGLMFSSARKAAMLAFLCFGRGNGEYFAADCAGFIYTHFGNGASSIRTRALLGTKFGFISSVRYYVKVGFAKLAYKKNTFAHSSILQKGTPSRLWRLFVRTAALLTGWGLVMQKPPTQLTVRTSLLYRMAGSLSNG